MRYFQEIIRFVRQNDFKKCLPKDIAFVLDDSMYMFSHKLHLKVLHMSSWYYSCQIFMHDQGLRDTVRTVNRGLRTKKIVDVTTLCPKKAAFSVRNGNLGSKGFFGLLPCLQMIWRAMEWPLPKTNYTDNDEDDDDDDDNENDNVSEKNEDDDDDDDDDDSKQAQLFINQLDESHRACRDDSHLPSTSVAAQSNEIDMQQMHCSSNVFDLLPTLENKLHWNIYAIYRLGSRMVRTKSFDLAISGVLASNEVMVNKCKKIEFELDALDENYQGMENHPWAAGIEDDMVRFDESLNNCVDCGLVY